MEQTNLYPKKQQIQEIYDAYRPIFAEIMGNIESRLRLTISLSSMPTYKSRIKSFKSYYRKVLRQKADEAETSKTLVTLTDMMGIRVICAFLEDIQLAVEQIKQNFDVKEVEYKGAEQNFREFGYESIHVLVAIPKECRPRNCDLPLPENLVCEIQVRTILQDAWAEVEHELIYKTEFTPFDMPLRRKLASMNASLSLADIIFQEIRDYQKKLQGEVTARRESFYEKVDEFTHAGESREKTRRVEQKNLTRVSPYVHGTIDDMILEAIQAHNRGELDAALAIYSQILDSTPEPPPPVLAVIRKHRGMAFFAKGMYDESLNDFTESVKNDPKGFRSYYYLGIVYSVMDKNDLAVQAFDKSLELNEYQSHAHYRRAVSYFKLGDDSKALADVTAAEQLGLEDDDCAALHEKIVKKMGMSM
ncbi:MAG: tetratricopeptide repeat protein [Treponema sp.]|nr:tetratricopeptide repeat protein [Treponema sp.]